MHFKLSGAYSCFDVAAVMHPSHFLQGLSYAYKGSQYSLVECHCYLKCIKILHDVSVLKGKLLFIQNNTGKEENEANTHCWENDHSLIYSYKTNTCFIWSKKRGYSWVFESAAFCLWETCKKNCLTYTRQHKVRRIYQDPRNRGKQFPSNKRLVWTIHASHKISFNALCHI